MKLKAVVNKKVFYGFVLTGVDFPLYVEIRFQLQFGIGAIMPEFF